MKLKLNSLLEILERTDRWLTSKRVKRKLIRRRIFDYELELLNEKWLIKRIQDGQFGRRKELAECQARIKEVDMFIKFFKNKKV